MTIIDYAILAVLVLSALVSLMRGFLKEAISLLSWVAAVVIALVYSPVLALEFTALLESALLRQIAAGAVLFVATLIVGAILSRLVAQLAKATGLGGLDRVLGSVFGVLRGAIIVLVAVTVASLLPGINQQPVWADSMLLPYVEDVRDGLKQLASDA